MGPAAGGPSSATQKALLSARCHWHESEIRGPLGSADSARDDTRKTRSRKKMRCSDFAHGNPTCGRLYEGAYFAFSSAAPPASPVSTAPASHPHLRLISHDARPIASA